MHAATKIYMCKLSNYVNSQGAVMNKLLASAMGYRLRLYRESRTQGGTRALKIDYMRCKIFFNDF
jgi:hypothetical protein